MKPGLSFDTQFPARGCWFDPAAVAQRLLVGICYTLYMSLVGPEEAAIALVTICHLVAKGCIKYMPQKVLHRR